MRLLFTIVLICTALSFSGLKAQETKRPKLGLVLSGGGAKGLAHIGVLKVLEEAGIRPDYITGTSMGSIIGGLYAAGYSANELDSIVKGIDWSEVLSDQVPLTDVAPEEKDDYNRFQLQFDITSDGLKLPAGMVRGQRISELLSGLTWRVSDCDSFDHLPIPFRCVAVDLIEGKPYVFKDGDLAMAMRASMAIPSVFTPVQIGDKYLVDGGVMDNFPVRLCREMGADIIIGVNAGFSDTLKIEDLNNIADVLMSASTIGSNINLEASIEETNYLITPDLKLYSAASFLDGVNIINKGEEAAKEQQNQFKQLADSLNSLALKPDLKCSFTSEKVLVSDIVIKNRDHISKRFFYNKLGFEPGDSVNSDMINAGTRRLVGTRFYNVITYELIPNEDNYDLVFDTEETEPAQAKFSIHYDNELKAGIIANVTLRNLITKNSRVSVTADISELPRLNTEVINYLGKNQSLGLIGDGYFERTELPLYDNDQDKFGTFNYYKVQAGAGLFFAIQRRTMITAKMNWKELMVSQKAGLGELFDNGVNRFGNGYFSSKLIIDRNTLNKRFFATKGHHFHMELNGNFKSYRKYQGDHGAKNLVAEFTDVPKGRYLGGILSYFTNTKFLKNTILETGMAIAANTEDVSFFEMHYIGGTAYNVSPGDAPFIGLNYREKMAENYAMLRLNLRVNLSETIYAHFVANGIQSFNYGNNAIEDNPFILGRNKHIIGFGGGIAINSIIGPITLGIGTNADDYNLRSYISIGFPFQ